MLGVSAGPRAFILHFPLTVGGVNITSLYEVAHYVCRADGSLQCLWHLQLLPNMELLGCHGTCENASVGVALDKWRAYSVTDAPLSRLLCLTIKHSVWDAFWNSNVNHTFTHQRHRETNLIECIFGTSPPRMKFLYTRALCPFEDVVLHAMCWVQCTHKQFIVLQHTWKSNWTDYTGHPVKCSSRLCLMKWI